MSDTEFEEPADEPTVEEPDPDDEDGPVDAPEKQSWP